MENFALLFYNAAPELSSYVTYTRFLEKVFVSMEILLR